MLRVMLVVVAPVFHKRLVAKLLAVSVSEVWVQVSVPLVGLILTVGAVVLLLTLTLVTLVQPDPLPTVTEYGPDELTTAVPAEAFWLTKPPPAKV